MKNLIAILIIALLLLGTNSQAQIQFPSDCFDQTKTAIYSVQLKKYYFCSAFECRMKGLPKLLDNVGKPDFYTISNLMYNEINALDKQVEEINKNQYLFTSTDKTTWNNIKYWITQLYYESRRINSLINEVSKLSSSSESDYDDNWFFALLNDIGTYSSASEKKEQLEKSWANFTKYGDNAFDTYEEYNKNIKSNLIFELQTIFKKFTCVDNIFYEAMISEDDKKQWFKDAFGTIRYQYSSYDDNSCEKAYLIDLIKESEILNIYKDAMNATFYLSYDDL